MELYTIKGLVVLTCCLDSEFVFRKYNGRIDCKLLFFVKD